VKKERYLLLIPVVLLSLFLSVKGATIAYWQMDDWSTRSIFEDVVGTYNLTAHPGHYQADNFVGANPIPNPDAGPFASGDPVNNTRSNRVVRGNTPGPVTTFNMTDSSSWTFEGWLHWTGGTQSGMVAGTRGAESGWAGWELMVVNWGRLDLRMTNSSGESVYVNTGTTALDEDAWHHIALVWDHDAGARGIASIYLDGSLVGSGAGNGDLGGGAKAFYLGGRDGSADGIYKFTQLGFNGYMDELRFSNEALEPSEFLTI